MLFSKVSRGALFLYGIIRNGLANIRRANAEAPESEQYNRALFELSPIGLALCRMNGAFVDVNTAYAKIIGRTVEETLTLSYWDITPEKFADQERMQLESIEKAGRYGPYEKEYTHKDGRLVPVRLQGQIIERRGEKFIWSSAEDITELKQAEEAMKRNERVLWLFVEHSPAALAMFDRDMKYIVTSRRFLMDYDLGDQNIIGRSHYEVFPEIPDRWREIHMRCLAGAVEKSEEDPFPRADGRMDWVRWEIHPWYETQGEIGGIILMSEVITERKQMDTELRKSEARIRNLFEQASDGIYVISAENRYLDANERGLEMLGYRRDELLQMSVADVLAPYEVARLAVEPPRMMSGVPHLAEWEHVRKDGSTFPGEVSARRLNDYSYLAILRDLTGRRLSEEALKKSAALLRETQQITKLGGWEYDVEKNRLMWTEEVYRIYDLSPDSYDPNNIRQDVEFYAPPDRQTIEQAFYKAVREGEPYDLELQFITAKGRHLWVRTIGKPVREDGKVARVVGNIMDITEQKKAGEMILRLTRLYSVLSKTNEAIVRTYEPEEFYRQVCRIVVEDGLFRMTWIGLVDPATLFIKPVAVCGHEDGYLRGMRISIDEKTPEGRGSTGRAVREGGYSLCNDIENDAAMAPWRDEALKRGYRSSAAFALKVGGQIVGTLNIYAGVPYHFQKEGEELLLLKTLAEDMSYAIESMETDKKRSQAEEALRSLASELEQRVMERTAKLDENIAKIERLNRLFVGRELRMKELKGKGSRN